MDDPSPSDAIDAYDELQEQGHFGRLGLQLLRELVRQELRRFPALLASAAAGADDLADESTQEFFAAKGAAVTAAVLAQAADLDSMARYLRKSVRYFLIDQARKTPSGSIRRKIEELLSATPQFGQVPPKTPGAGRWQLVDAPRPPYGGELRPLVAAAYAVREVEAVRWSGERRAPLASDRSLVTILTAVFTAADGSLEVAQLTAVFLQRFPAAVEYPDAALDDETFQRTVAPLEDRPDVAVEVSDQARDVYAQLSPSQRTLMPHLTKPVAEQMKVLGVGRTQAYTAVSRLKALLTQLIPDDAQRADVTEEVWRLCVVNP